MTSKQKATIVIEKLKELYPKAPCSLDYQGSVWKLLIMAMLSAQCKDERVNQVSVGLFEKIPSIRAFADANPEQLELAVKPCGLYRAKAKNIKAACKMLIEKFNSEIPQDMDSLLSLPGVGRKIANLMIGDVFGGPAIVTDTHCIRISERLGLTNPGEKDPYRTEKALLKIIPPEESSDFCHRLVYFGRDICIARNPKCSDCPFTDLCRSKNNGRKK